MIIELANAKDKKEIARLDRHIPSVRLDECILSGRVYVLKEELSENADHSSVGDIVVGVLRFSLFWQTVPFLDLIYIDEKYQNKGFGREMMRKWEEAMRLCGYRYTMTSTQADEDAWSFYEKLGYRKAGGFFPPEQKAEEWIYVKKLDGPFDLRFG